MRIIGGIGLVIALNRHLAMAMAAPKGEDGDPPPKHHMFQHFCEWQYVELGNPKFYWVNAGEDLVGQMIEVSRSCPRHRSRNNHVQMVVVGLLVIGVFLWLDPRWVVPFFVVDGSKMGPQKICLCKNMSIQKKAPPLAFLSLCRSMCIIKARGRHNYSPTLLSFHKKGNYLWSSLARSNL